MTFDILDRNFMKKKNMPVESSRVYCQQNSSGILFSKEEETNTWTDVFNSNVSSSFCFFYLRKVVNFCWVFSPLCIVSLMAFLVIQISSFLYCLEQAGVLRQKLSERNSSRRRKGQSTSVSTPTSTYTYLHPPPPHTHIHIKHKQSKHSRRIIN